MTREEAEKLAEVLSKGIIPAEYRYRGTHNTLKVQDGWVRLGGKGIQAVVVHPGVEWLSDMDPVPQCAHAKVRVMVGRDWYFLDTEEKE